MVPNVSSWSTCCHDSTAGRTSLIRKASDPAPTPFPHLAKWYTGLMTPPTPYEAALAMKRQRAIAFTSVRDDIWGYWEKMDAAGQFQPIVDEIAAAHNTLQVCLWRAA